MNTTSPTTTSPIELAFNGAVQDYDTHAIIQRRVAHYLATLIMGRDSVQKKLPYGILEIGCGTGFLTESLLEKHPDTPYYATDIAPSMVQACLQKLGQFPNLTGFVMDGERIDGENLPPQVDWIVSSLAFQWFRDFPRSLKSLWDRTHNLAFSTLLEGTFQQWTDLCDHHNVDNAVRSFCREEDLVALCESLNPAYFHFEIREETQTFRGPLEFLQSLKKIGAHTPRDLASGINSPLLKFLKTTQGHDFTITYRVAYCVLGR